MSSMQDLNHLIEWLDGILEHAADNEDIEELELHMPVEDVQLLRDFLDAYRKKSVEEYKRALSHC